MNQSPQAHFDVHRLQDRLSLRRPRQHSARDQVRRLLRIGYGIQVVEDLFWRKRRWRRTGFGLTRGHDWEWKRQPKLDSLLEQFAKFGNERVDFNVITRRRLQRLDPLDSIWFIPDRFFQFDSGQPLED